MTDQTKTVWLIRIDRDHVSREGGLAVDINVVTAVISEWLDAWTRGDWPMWCLFLCGHGGFSASNGAPRTFAISHGVATAICQPCAKQSDAVLLMKISEITCDHTFECRPLGFYHSPSSSVN
jgi:hypothetical protein